MGDFDKSTYLPEEMADEIRYTLDLLRTIDAGKRNAYDLSLRQISKDSSYDQIWLVSIEDGAVKINFCDYLGEYTNISEWTDISLGEYAIDAAIEFDGWWYLRPAELTYTLVTDEFPWIFWVTPDYVLHAQHGFDASTRIMLDTNVTSICACRGFSSNDYLERDQGLVVAYIKGNAPYYVQYIYNTNIEAKYWTLPEELCELKECLSIKSHRLNDFRLGFEISTTNKNIWAYTSRTYVSQKMEIITREMTLVPEKTMFLYTLKDTDLNIECSSGISADLKTISINVSKPIRYFYTWRDLVSFEEESVTDGMVRETTVTNSENDSVIEIKLVAPPKTLITNVTLNPTGSPAVQAIIPDFGYILVPMTTFNIDTTLYSHLPSTLLETFRMLCNVHGIEYIDVEYVRGGMYLETVSTVLQDSNISYESVIYRSGADYMEQQNIGIRSSGIVYTQVETLVL